jgi:hypothetical protein
MIGQMTKQTLFILAVSMVLIAAAHAERVPLKADELTEFFQKAVPYGIPKPETAEALINPYAKVRAPAALTYDAATELYTYWYTDEAGERQVVNFDLGNRVRVTITARADANTDRSRFTYVYTIRNLEDSPQGLHLVMLELLDPSDIDEIILEKGWGSMDSPSLKRMVFYHRSSITGLPSGEVISVKLRSRRSPVLSTCLLKAVPGGPGFHLARRWVIPG